jgi:GAG-pre-integrase domain
LSIAAGHVVCTNNGCDTCVNQLNYGPRIFDKGCKIVGEIVMGGGLYRIYQECHPDSKEFAGKANEVVTIDELHRHMGHVSHSAARALVQKKLVSGIELDESSKPLVCESCKWVKGVWKEIQRTCNGDHTAAVGDEVQSDLWGPAPVETIN